LLVGGGWSGALAQDSESPTVSVTDPSDGAVVQSQSTIAGSATDNQQVASVELTIQRASDDSYWDGSGWVSTSATVSATADDGAFDSGEETWSYGTSSITGEDTYTVTAEATDGADNTETATVSYTIDTTAPAISGGSLAPDNAYVDVSFSEGVYTNSDGTGALTTGDLTLTFTQNGGSATDATIDDVTTTGGTALSGGEDVVRVQISLTNGPASGDETIEIQPTDGSSIYDDAGNAMASGETTGALSLNDQRAPVISGVSLDNDGGGDLSLSFESDEQLGGDASDLAVSVDGPSGSDVYTFDRTAFSESGSGPYTYDLTATQAYDDGDGTYTAIVDAAVDGAGNDGASGESDTYTLDTSAPSVSVTDPSDGAVVQSQSTITGSASDNLQVSGVTLTIQRTSDGNYWDGGTWVSSETTVSASPTDGDGFGDATEDWTYDASSIDGEDTYDVTAEATDGDGNTSTTTVAYTIDTTAPSISGVTLGNNGSGNLDFSFDSDEQLGSGTSDIAVTVDGPTSGSDVYSFNEGDFSETDNGDGSYTYDLTTTQAYDDGDGTYTAAVDDAVDPAGNDGADGSQTDSYTFDATAPTISGGTVAADNAYVDVSFSEGVYANSDGSGALTTGDLTLTFAQNGGSATDATIDDVTTTGGTALSGGEVEVRVQISLTNGPASGDETVEIQPTDASSIYDDAGNAMGSSETTDPLSLNDQKAPSITNVTLGNDGAGNLTFSFDADEQLGSGTSDIAVTVDGPSGGSDVYSFNGGDFTETDNGDGTYTYVLSADQAYDDGDGTYQAAVDAALDLAGNDGATGESDTYTLDTTAPTISNVTLSNDGSDNLAFSFDSDETLSSITVTVDGPNTSAAYTFDETDFTESGGTYTLSTTQAYDDGDGTYTAAVDDAVDPAGNDGADGTQTDTYTLDTSAPTISVTDPSDGAVVQSQSTIAGSASDNQQVASVDLAIQRTSDGSYWDGNTWVSSETTVSASATDGDGFGDATEDWTYDASSIDGEDTYEITAEATDGDGNTQATTISYTIDTTAPTVSGVTLGNDGSGNLDFQFDTDEQLGSGTSDIAVTVDGPSTTDVYSFDGSDFSETDNGDGTYTYDLTATEAYGSDGTYTAAVDDAVDPAGNDGADGNQTDSYTFDATAPAISAGTLAADNAYVDVSFSEGGYANSDGSGALTTGDLTLTFTQNGGSATDATIDGLTTTGGNALSGGEDAVRVQISLTNGPASGDETVEIEPTDESSIYDDAGNAMGSDETTGALSLNDRRAPEISSVSLENDGSNNLSFSFEADEQLGADPSDLAVSVDGPSGSDIYTFDRTNFSESGSGPYTYTLSADQSYDNGDGTYEATVDDALDPAGNDGADGTQTDSYVLDTSAPAVSVTDPSDGAVVQSQNTIVGSASDNLQVSGATLTIQRTSDDSYWDGGTWVSSETTVSASATDGDGFGDATEDWSYNASSIDGEDTYEITAEASDESGNTQAATVSYTIDTTAPTVTISDPNDGDLVQSQDQISGSASDAIQVSEVRLTIQRDSDNRYWTGSGWGNSETSVLASAEDGAFDSGSESWTYEEASSITSDDTYTVTAEATDGADNTETTTTSYTIDATAPSISAVSLTNDGANNLDLQFESTEPLASIAVTVDGPSSDDVYTFDETDFSASGSGSSFTYTLNTDQAYAEGGGSYTAAVDDAVDDAGNDGADGSQSDSYVLPTAQDDALTTDEETSISDGAPGVLGNDSPSDLSVSAVNGAGADVGSQITLSSGALLTLNADGSYDYAPNGAFEDLDENASRDDSFTYTALGPEGGTAQATVTVTVNGENDAPVVSENTALVLDAAGNTKTITTSNLSASDPDDAPTDRTFTVTAAPSNGRILVGGTQDGSFTQADLENNRIAYEHDGSNRTTDDFTFTLSDDVSTESAEQTFDIFIDVDNRPPSASNDEATTTEDDVLSVTQAGNGVLANDEDPDNDNLTVSSVGGSVDNVGAPVSLSAGGTVTINADGTYSFDPADDYQDLANGESASPSVTYTASDGRGGTDDAALTVTVTGDNDAPTLPTNDGLVVQVGESGTITTSLLSAADVDDDASALTFTLTDGPSQGQILVDGSPASSFTQQNLDDGVVQYEHTASTADDDSFTFDLSDDDGAGPTGNTFAITVQEGTPTATGDDYTATEDQTLSVTDPANGVLANDSDPEGDDLEAILTQTPDHGSLSFNGDGTFDYTPDADYNGPDSFVYAAEDPNGNRDDATVQLTVEAVNDPPRITTNDGVTVDRNGTTTLTTAALDASDIDDAPSALTYTVTTAPSHGTLQNTASSATIGSGGTFTQADLENGDIAYQHDGSDTASDEFTFDLTDDDGAGPTGNTFAITVQEGTPTATGDDYTATEDETLAVTDPANGVLANDSDPEGEDLTAFLSQTPEHGTLTFNRDGTFEYTPDSDYNGPDQFVYAAEDPNGNRNEATVQLTVEPVNDPPRVATNTGTSVDNGGTRTIATTDLSATDVDDEPSALTFTVTDGPSNGQIRVGGAQAGSFTQADLADGRVTYRHDGSDTNADSFTFDLTDDDGAGPTGRTFDITIQEGKPVAQADTFAATEDETLSVTDPANGVLANDSDPEGEDLTASLSQTPDHGSLNFSGDGTFSYTPDPDYNGPDQFVYVAADPNTNRDTATVQLNVAPVNDPPRVATNEGITVSEGGATTLTPSVLDATDIDDGPSTLTFTVTDPPSQGRILVDGAEAGSFTQQALNDGTVRYDHTASTADDDSFTFDLSDDDGAGPTGQTFAITVQEGTPTATDDDYTATENQTLSVTEPGNGVLANDRDPEGENLEAIVTQTPNHGDLRLDADGTFEYTPTPGYNGPDQFVYAAEDPNGNRDTATVRLTVEKNNVPPVAADDRYLTEEDQTLAVTDSTEGVLANDSDPDEEDRLVATVTDSTDNGTVRLDTTAGTFEYVPDGGFSGADSFQYEVRDGQGGTDRATASIQVRPDRSSVAVERSFPDPTDQRSFRLVALPGGAGPSLASTLSGQRGDDWRAFREQGASGSSSYSRTQCGAGTDCALGGGTGYWLIARDAWSVEDSIETVALRPDTASSTPVYRVPLQDGWNAISNPLETDVPWSAVQAASGTNQALYRWDGSWDPASTFTSAAEGEAYYFRDDQLDTLVVPYPSPQSSAARAKAHAEAPTLTLHAVRDGDTLSTAHAVQHDGAAVGLDSTDRYGPPGYFGGASLRFRAEGEDRRPALRTEGRPPGPQGQAYDLRLRAAPDTALTLVARGAAAFPGERVVLANRAQGRTHDLRADSSVTLAPSSETTRFRLLVGSRSFVEDAQEALAPDETTLMPNYPNPFRRATTIEYALEERQEVRLAIYDVLGRRVQVLVDGTKRAGFHRLQWQGEGRDGRPVASGVYFARLVAGSTTETERLVVVR
jgi:VCBS repeat-containing protein